MSPAKLSRSMVASPQSPLPFHLAKSLYLCCAAEPRKHRWRCLLPPKWPLPASLFQLAIAGRMDLSLSSSQHILWKHRCASAGAAAVAVQTPTLLREGLPFHRDSSPACRSTRHTLAGLTANTS